MPKFLNKIFTKLQKRAAQPREGYFVLFFAVVLTMLMLPVLSGVLTTTVETRSEIADYYQAETARNEGESILFNKLESLSREHGLGYFETDIIETEDGRTVEYTFSAASVVTTPSTYTYGDLNLATPRTPTACSTWVDEDDDGDLSFRGCEEEYPELATAVDDPYFYYTVPALGTGDVGGADCQPGKLPPELEGVEDPLDHPCSWNKLSLGQNVAIPLYINTSESETTYEVYKPESLTLRLRFKCEEFEDTYCPDEERLYITHEDLDLRADGLRLEPNPTVDATPRVLDWAVEGKELVLPDNRGDFTTESGRADTNIELTIQRFIQENRDINNFFYLSSERVLTVNLLSLDIVALLISDAFDSDAIEENFLDFYDADGLLSLESGAPEDADIFTVTEDAPILNLGFLNDYFEGCNRSECRQITEIEYQLISNVPMGNHKFVATGISENVNSTYALMKAEKSGPEVPTLPGTVFGS